MKKNSFLKKKFYWIILTASVEMVAKNGTLFDIEEYLMFLYTSNNSS